MSPITTHILDTQSGRPAAGVSVLLELNEIGEWRQIGQGVTNDDGRITNLLHSGSLNSGNYRICFDTGSYFESIGVESFYPHVTVEFEIKDDSQHYHVPLLLSPFGYSTYRGS